MLECILFNKSVVLYARTFYSYLIKRLSNDDILINASGMYDMIEYGTTNIVLKKDFVESFTNLIKIYGRPNSKFIKKVILNLRLISLKEDKKDVVFVIFNRDKKPSEEEVVNCILKDDSINLENICFQYIPISLKKFDGFTCVKNDMILSTCSSHILNEIKKKIFNDIEVNSSFI